MLRAIRLAERGRGAAGTNPLVGAMVVKGGRVSGSGWYRQFGGPHAEAIALANAGNAARGADLYVTMEPCDSTGKTPPCTRMIVASGIKRVVIGLADPSQGGNGIRELKRRGIRVDIGAERARIREQNADFFLHRSLGRPVVTLKLALTLDGRIADRFGSSKWISSAAARKWTRKLRGRSDAVMVGSSTAHRDDPGLRAPQPGRKPLKIIVDRRATVGPDLRLIREGKALVAVGAAAPAGRVRELQLAGARVVRLASGRNGVDLQALLRGLYSEGVGSVLCEGGGRLAGALLDRRLIDRMFLVFAPKILADSSAPAGFAGKSRSLSQAMPVRIIRRFTAGGDAIMEAEFGRTGK